MNKVVFLKTSRTGLRLFLLLAVACLSLGTGSVNIAHAGASADSGSCGQLLANAKARFMATLSPDGSVPASPEMRAAAIEYIRVSKLCYDEMTSQDSVASLQGDTPTFIDNDGILLGSNQSSASFALTGGKWGSSTLGTSGGTVTYSFMGNGVDLSSEPNSSGFGKNVAIASLPGFQPCFITEIQNAFAAWQAVSNLKFVLVSDNNVPFGATGATGDIRIGAHYFDGPSNTLAHAYFPVQNAGSGPGDLHFDKSENWTCNASGIDIGIVALHEIGHSIGLNHQANPPVAMMNPIYNSRLTALQPDDINGATAIYGPAALSVASSNDDFSNATLINGLTFTDDLDTTGATTAATDPSNVGPCDGHQLQQGGQTVWYQYTPAANESIAADTSGSDYDTYLAIWTGSEGNLSLVTCDDDDLNGYTSQLSFIATSGTTYYFEVAAYTGRQGQPPQPSFGGNLSFHVNISNLDVLVGTSKQSSYYITNNSTITDMYPSIVDGPVKVKSTVGDNILTSQRVTSGDSYNELIGLPANQFTTEYWFPYYDHGYPNVAGSNMRTWILVGNPSSTTTANVQIYIGGVLQSDPSNPASTTFSIAAGKNITPRWIGKRGGPVQVVSDIPIFASERVFTSNNNSFNEVLGFPANQFTTEYWFPWYDSKAMQNFIMVGNTSSTKSATVKIYIAGAQKGKYTISPHSTISKSYSNVVNGPVRVVSTNGINIITSQKTTSGTGNSYNEVIGYPFNQFATQFWFPYYDHGYPYVFGSNMRTWVLVGNPSTSQTALVQIYIGGVLQSDPNNPSSTTFSIAPGKNVTPRWLGVQGGPVRVVSTNGVNIFASERVFTVPNSVFNEMMAFPANQLTTEYWYPWYDSTNTNNDILVIKP